MSDQITIYTYKEFSITYYVCVHVAFGLRIKISKSYNNYDKYVIPLNLIPFIIINKICINC